MADADETLLERMREWLAWQESVRIQQRQPTMPIQPNDPSLFRGRKLVASPPKPPEPKSEGGKNSPKPRPLMNLRGAMKSLRR